MNKTSETDWARVDALTDDTIDTSDIPPLTTRHFARAVLRAPQGAATLTVQVDPDVLAWFEAQGDECESAVNAALRRYMEAPPGPSLRNTG